jgi:serine/threonine-protein kinase
LLRVDGYVKLLDFGLAKILPWSQGKTAELSPPSSITESGVIVGTFAYMSPEQVRGHAVTPASDVFSFGIVLYEMLAGEHPFQAETPMDTVSAILSREVPLLHARAPAVSRELSEVCSRALEKDSSKRYASALDLREEFERALAVHTRGVSATAVQPSTMRHKPRWMQAVGAALIAFLLGFAGWRYSRSPATSALVPHLSSVAVMNLRVASDDAQAATLAQDLPEELDAALAKAGFQVASRSSVLELDRTLNARDAAVQLGVEAVVDGSVRSYLGKFKVHLEVVNARTGFQVWSDTFTADSADLFADEKQVSAEVATKLREAVAAPR